MSPLLLALAATVTADPLSFRADFPGAAMVESSEGGRLIHASAFEAAGLGSTPEAAARAFLARYGDAFGITEREDLVARTRPTPGRPGAVRFERCIEGRPLFDGDVVVGLDARNAVVLVNSADVPRRITGRARVSRVAAIRAALAALPELEHAAGHRAERGWRASGGSVRPVWRVDIRTSRPPGEWRSYVDAETGEALARVELRARRRRRG